MGEQQMIDSGGGYRELDHFFRSQAVSKIMLVCGKNVSALKIGKYFEQLKERLGVEVVLFRNFSPNPLYESVEQGVRMFRETGCEMIVAAGGGSAMDVAKCIKLFVPMKQGEHYLKQEIRPSEIPFLAIPTTAGTGSEATHFAVIYVQGEKQSVAHPSCLPDAVMLDAALLESLPLYQRKATYLDAFCHALESYWSVHSTQESRQYADDAIRIIMEYGDGYLENRKAANKKMLHAAYLAGKAINITKTTAGHALCYKLTTQYGIAHGHAAALCTAGVWRYMLGHLDDCMDARGKAYLGQIFGEIAKAMGCDEAEDALVCFEGIIEKLELSLKPDETQIDWEGLVNAVNVERLGNNPIRLTEDAILGIYRQILMK